MAGQDPACETTPIPPDDDSLCKEIADYLEPMRGNAFALAEELALQLRVQYQKNDKIRELEETIVGKDALIAHLHAQHELERDQYRDLYHKGCEGRAQANREILQLKQAIHALAKIIVEER